MHQFVPFQVVDFTANGKKCLERLQLQIDIRLPAHKPEDCLAVLLDPATKCFTDWLLGQELALETTNLLRKLHVEAYTALNNKGTPQADAELEALQAINDVNGAGLQEPEDLDGEVGMVDEDIEGPSIMLEQGTNEESEVDGVAKANEVFDNWMEFNPKFGDYLIEGATPLVPNRATGKVTFRDIVSKFDTRDYFRTHGLVAVPSITLLARIHFSTTFNRGFLERVFSSCKNVMGVDQVRIPMKHLEMKALVYQNAELIRKGII